MKKGKTVKPVYLKLDARILSEAKKVAKTDNLFLKDVVENSIKLYLKERTENESAKKT